MAGTVDDSTINIVDVIIIIIIIITKKYSYFLTVLLLSSYRLLLLFEAGVGGECLPAFSSGCDQGREA